MRREAGAIIVILVCFLVKCPGLVRDLRWKPEKMAANWGAGREEQPGVLKRFPSKSGPKRVLANAPPPHSTSGSDSGSADTLSARLPGADTCQSHRPDPSKRTSSSFFADPLRFLSTATPESLATLPGIGPVLAERIANAADGKRPFTSWEDLLSVRGIGPKKLENLRRIARER